MQELFRQPAPHPENPVFPPLTFEEIERVGEAVMALSQELGRDPSSDEVMDIYRQNCQAFKEEGAVLTLPETDNPTAEGVEFTSVLL